MDARLTETAQICLNGAENNSMTFPQIVGMLMQAGIESYAIDFRRATATYYLPHGDSVVLPTHRDVVPIAETLDSVAVQAAIGRRSNWCLATLTQDFARRSWRLVA